MSIQADETLRERWSRRVMSVGMFAGALFVFVALSPLWVPLALVVDIATRGRTAFLRGLFYLMFFLAMDLYGVVAAIAFFCARPLLSRERYLACHYWYQGWWAATLMKVAGAMFRLRYFVEGAEQVSPGPVVVLVRHASVGDTMVPLAFVSHTLGFRFRYVIKRELLWDPCLDIVGHRFPNLWVRRGGEGSAREIGRVGKLAEGMSAREGIVIYPEGTRFTPEKREQVIRRLESKKVAPRQLDIARSLKHVLPLRAGGVLAALRASPDADVVLCAHTGLEGLTTLRDFLSGRSSDRHVHIRFWRLPRASVPVDDEERMVWLLKQWAELDAWIGAAGASDASPAREATPAAASVRAA